ncbi:MAG: hypothetical protein ACQEP5_09370 [Actinomycetota bacterium]
MKYIKSTLIISALLIFFYFLFPNSVYAYLDAGSGSYIIQIIIGIAIGGAFGIKIFWRRIHGFFTNTSARKKKGDRAKKH